MIIISDIIHQIKYLKNSKNSKNYIYQFIIQKIQINELKIKKGDFKCL